MFIKLFQKLQREGILPNSFYKASITLTLKTCKSTSIKRKRQISLMNTDAKIFNNILANWIPEHITKIIKHGPVGFIPGIKDAMCSNQQT
jgi:transcription antitermination factor NusA-like protein